MRGPAWKGKTNEASGFIESFFVLVLFSFVLLLFVHKFARARAFTPTELPDGTQTASWSQGSSCTAASVSWNGEEEAACRRKGQFTSLGHCGSLSQAVWNEQAGAREERPSQWDAP
mmetsp:Transcript_47060/g.131218  ORF Transcript_47060/g.131218 Transcript_47060/m.131218 type:complete len:116 (+) Transcript_47060:319-666(+)